MMREGDTLAQGDYVGDADAQVGTAFPADGGPAAVALRIGALVVVLTPAQAASLGNALQVEAAYALVAQRPSPAHD